MKINPIGVFCVQWTNTVTLPQLSCYLPAKEYPFLYNRWTMDYRGFDLLLEAANLIDCHGSTAE